MNWNNKGQTPIDQRASVCQWTRPDDHTLLCLLDRPPEELAEYDSMHPDNSGIVLSQPPHQQRFSFGHAYNPSTNKFEFILRRLYTGDKIKEGEWKAWKYDGTDPNRPDLKAAQQIDLDFRVLDVGELARTINQGIQGPDPENSAYKYEDYVPNSAELALELNDPAYYFAIYPHVDHHSDNTTQRSRQLWAAKLEPKNPDTPSTPPPGRSDPIGPPVQPPLAEGPTPIIPVRPDVPGSGSKVIVVDHPVMPADQDKGNVPQNMMPKKCFTMNVFADYRGLRAREDGTYEAGDYIPTKSKYLIGMYSFERRKLAG